MAIALAGAGGLLWLLSRSASAATLNCKPPAFAMRPGNPDYLAALDHSPGKTGYCAVQGNVTDAGAQTYAPEGIDAIGASVTGAIDAGLDKLLGLFGSPSSSSTPTDGTITRPEQLDGESDPLGDV